MAKHLYEFDSSGFYAADSREEAFALVAKNLGCSPEEVSDDFLRDVPDEEVIDPYSEDSWDHPMERAEKRGDQGGVVYFLRLPAAEHARIAPDWGYCFGGEE